MSFNLQWISKPIKVVSEEAKEQAKDHFSKLTTFQGSLGVLEALAIRLAGMQRSLRHSLDPARIVVFAADHGVANEPLCTLPKKTTRSMVGDCLRGVSPIARMVQQLNVDLELVDVGMRPSPEGVVSVPSTGGGRIRFMVQAVAPGSADFRFGSAMTHEQFSKALHVGRDAVNRAIQDGNRIILGGEIGVGGTMSAVAVACAFLKVPPESLAESGHGILTPEGLARRVEVVQQGLDAHVPFHSTAMESLRRLGGFEIAALTGAFIACGQRGLPAVVDGFVASVAALVAIAAHPPLHEWLIFAHCSPEPGQSLIFRRLAVQPVLDMNIYWGEGVGAATALPILRLAHRFLSEESPTGV